MYELDNKTNVQIKETSVNKRASFPKNVRQIGKCDENRRIYIEDYVITFIRQLAMSNKESYIVLLGSEGPVEGIPATFINGAIRVEHSDILLKETISKENWDDIYYKIQNYFDGLKILGWGCLTQVSVNDNNYGFMLQKYSNVQRKNFPGNDKVFIHYNIFGQEETLYNVQNDELRQCHGYYVYYERNESMQVYMMNENNSCGQEQHDENDITNRIRSTLNDNEELKQARHSRKRRKEVTRADAQKEEIKGEKTGIIVKGKEESMNSMQKIYTGVMVAAVCLLIVAAARSSKVSASDVINAISQRIEKTNGKNNNKDEVDITRDKGENFEVEVVEGVTPKPSDSSQQTISEVKNEEKDKNENKSTKKPNADKSNNEKDSNDDNSKDKKDENEKVNKEDENNKNESKDIETIKEMGCKEYQVKKGDTLAKISIDEYGTMLKVKDICELNNIADENMIHEGDIIYLPKEQIK